MLKTWFSELGEPENMYFQLFSITQFWKFNTNTIFSTLYGWGKAKIHDVSLLQMVSLETEMFPATVSDICSDFYIKITRLPSQKTFYNKELASYWYCLNQQIKSILVSKSSKYFTFKVFIYLFIYLVAVLLIFNVSGTIFNQINISCPFEC